MKKALYVAVFSCLMALVTLPVFATSQSDPKPALKENTKQSGQWWFNLGVGAGGGNGGFGGPAATISANYRVTEHQLITARLLNNSGFIFDASQFKDVGLMYGLIAKGKYAYISGSAGLAYAEFHHEDRPFFGGPAQYNDTKRTVGIPAEIQLFLTPTPYVGIGIIGFADLNSAKSVDGVMIALQIGNLD